MYATVEVHQFGSGGPLLMDALPHPTAGFRMKLSKEKEQSYVLTIQLCQCKNSSPMFLMME